MSAYRQSAIIAFNRAVKAGVMFWLEAQRKTTKGDVTMTRQQMVNIVLQAQRMNAIFDAQATKPPHRGRPEADRRTVKTTRLTPSRTVLAQPAEAGHIRREVAF